MAKIFPFASVKRKLSGSRPEWRLATSGARVVAAAIASSLVAKIQISFSTGMAPSNRLRTLRAPRQRIADGFGYGSLGLDVVRPQTSSRDAHRPSQSGSCELLCRRGLPEKKTLRLIEPHFAHGEKISLRFDSFGDGACAIAICEVEDLAAHHLL